MSSLKEEDRVRIQSFFTSVNTLKFQELEGNTQLSKEGAPLTKYFRKDAYSSPDELEQAYSLLFRPHLLQAWDRLYHYKKLGEYDILDKESTCARLFRSLTGYLVTATDNIKACCHDVLNYDEGRIIRYERKWNCSEFLCLK